MKTRALLALSAVLAVGATTGAAHAAVMKPTVKPVCNLVKDDAGDGSGLTGKEDSLDVLSADIASDKTQVTAVIRLKAAPKGPNPNYPEGASWAFNFDAPGEKYPLFLEADIDPSGALSYSYGDIEPLGASQSYTPKGTATGFVKGNEIHMTVPVAVLSSLATVKPGSKINGLGVTVSYGIGVPPNASGVFIEALRPADDATGKSYIAGSLSCVKPGH